MSKEKGLEEIYFGKNGGADEIYPCFRDEYSWGSDRPSVPDSRVPAKENTVIHGLQADAEKFEAKGEEFQSFTHYKLAADYWNMAGDRRKLLMISHPDLIDTGHLDAVDFCYNKARKCQELSDVLNHDDESIYTVVENSFLGEHKVDEEKAEVDVIGKEEQHE